MYRSGMEVKNCGRKACNSGVVASSRVAFRSFSARSSVWDGNPFSVYSRVARVYIDGALVFERGNPDVNPTTDFMLGTTAMTGGAK